MSDPTTGREALIAELVGDVAGLLKRVDELVPALNAACADLVRASADLQDQATKTSEGMHAMTEAAKALVVQHIAGRAGEIVRSTAEREARAMELAVREILRAELASAMHRLDQVATSGAGRRDGRWWTYVVAVVGTALATAATTLWLIGV